MKKVHKIELINKIEIFYLLLDAEGTQKTEIINKIEISLHLTVNKIPVTQIENTNRDHYCQ